MFYLTLQKGFPIEKVRHFYTAHPQISNASTGFLTFSVGDIVAQKLKVNSDGNINFGRSLQLGMLGIAMNGFFLHRWFAILDTFIGNKVKYAVAKKVLADQVIYAPFAILSFFGCATALKPAGPESKLVSFENKIKSDFIKTYVADCTIWPMANAINFRFVPLVYRASFTATVVSCLCRCRQ